MAMNKVSWLVGLMLLLASGTALAVPQTMNFTGRLATSAGPVTNNVTLIFRIFDAPTNGVQEWTETHASVAATNGLVYVDLGATSALDENVFDGTAKYLEIVVNGELLTPRMKLNSVPYAVRANVAESADALGTLLPADVITTVTPGAGIAATKTSNALTLGLSTSGCSSGYVWKYNGSTFSCQADTDTDTVPTAGTGISVSSSTVSLSTSGCAMNYVWKYNGSSFACAPDSDTPPVAGNGIAVSTRTVSLSTSGCSAGFVWKYNGSTMVCAADTDTTYTSGQGIAISGAIPNIIGFSTTGCSAGYVWKYDGMNWKCDPDATASLNAGTGIAISSGTISVDGTVARKDSAAGNQSFDSGTLFLDYTGNRVGINNTAPVQPLDVTGTVRASEFLYSAPRTGIVFVNGASFTTNPSFPAVWSKSSLVGRISSGGSEQYLNAPIDIPNGSTITNLTCYIMDDDTTADLAGTMNLTSWGYGGTNSVNAVVSASITTTGASQNTQTFSTSTSATYDNSSAGYYIFIDYQWSATPSILTNSIFGCKVTYTMARAGN
jgi:hypothetical protein